MCGITGFISTDLAPEDQSLAITAMTNSLTHRGPDEQGIWQNKALNLAFGHRRLSILDLSPTGAQPIPSDDGMGVLVFNGEIYNYRAISKELEALGYKFRGSSDTEVVLKAILQWGIDA